MALPSTGPLDLRAINLELKRSATARFEINDSLVRELAEKTTVGSEISFLDLRGKAYLNQELVVDAFLANRDRFNKWIGGEAGDIRNKNFLGANSYVASDVWTANFSLASIDLPDTEWTTIVINLSGKSPVFIDQTVNGGNQAISSVAEIYNQFEQRQRVLYVNTSYKNITSVSVNWSYTYAIFRGAWAAMTVIPGRWTGYNYAVQAAKTATTGITRDTIHIGTYYGSPDWALEFVKPTTGAEPSALMRFDGWYGNNGGFYTVINNGTATKSYNIACGNYGTVNGVSYIYMLEP